jgi:hypothetical protein
LKAILFANYDITSRPVLNASSILNISIGFTLHQILSMVINFNWIFQFYTCFFETIKKEQKKERKIF